LPTFPVPDPKVVCIEDLSPGAIAGTVNGFLRRESSSSGPSRALKKRFAFSAEPW